MSGTFVQPSTPTTGLQNYNLEHGVKRLYPGLIASRLARRALLRNRPKRGLTPSRLAKGLGMADGQVQGNGGDPDELQKMIAAMRGSVASIVAAGGDGVEQALEKSFGEFEGALREAVGQEIEAVATAPLEPLFKGLGAVGRIASLAKMVADQVDLIKNGQDYKDQGRANDPAGEDVCAMLDSGQHCIELALRSAVNEHVGPLDDGDDPNQPMPGMVYIHVPDPEDGDGGDVVKSDLPLELAKFATWPDLLESQKMELGGGLMLLGGMPESTLEKLFSTGGLEALAKGNLDPMAPDGSAVPPAGADDGSQTPDDGSQDDPLDVLGRILAAAMIQLDHIRQLLDGSGDGATPDDGTGAGDGGNPPDPASAPATGAAPPPAKKAPPFMKKLDEGQLMKFDGAIEEIGRRLQAVEGVIPVMADLSKGVAMLTARLSQPMTPAPALMDISGGGQLAKAEGLGGDSVVDALAKMSPEERVVASIKAEHRAGPR